MFQNIKKNFKLQVLVCIVLSTFVIIVYFIFNNILNMQEYHSYTITEDIKVINSVEDITIENGYLFLDGYAFSLRKDTDNMLTSLFLHEINTDNEIWPKVKQTARPDINSYYMSEFNYENSGFQASIKEKELKDDKCYEIFINLDYIDEGSDMARSTVSTNQFILNGQLYDYNPYEFSKPIFKDKSLLDEVLSYGQLCFYNKDIGIYIYQYQGKLYWIATSEYEFNQNGKTYIPYQLHTSQTGKLPVDRVQHDYDNLDFYFEQFEYIDEAIEPYRVAIRDIPQDYPITFIETGHYDIENKNWLWNKKFHLDNLFK